MRALDDPDPASVVFVDDQPGNLRGAERCGMVPVWFDPVDVPRIDGSGRGRAPDLTPADRRTTDRIGSDQVTVTLVQPSGTERAPAPTPRASTHTVWAPSGAATR